jgi:hypothetical protein
MGSQVVEDRVLERSLIYNEFLRPQVNMHHLAGAIVPFDCGHYAVVGVHGSRDAKAYEPTDVRRWVSRCHTSFDRLSLGVILMGPTGKLLAHERCRRVARVPGGIRAMAKQEDKRLHELIVGARTTSGLMTTTATPGGDIRIGRLSGRQAYAVMVAPVRKSAAGNSAAAVLVFISDLGRQFVSDLAILKELFGFPPSEARLVLALLNGIAAPDFARQVGLSYHTVRRLLVRAMDRTDTRSH